MIKNENEVKEIYNSKIEKINESHGFSLSYKRIKNGWLVFKWYSRNTWVDDVKERTLFFRDDNKIFENHKQIATF